MKTKREVLTRIKQDSDKLSADTYNRLREWAKKNHIKMYGAVNMAIELFLKEKEA